MNSYRYYFQLQGAMLQRQMREWGVHPAVALVLALLVFTAGSYILFSKTGYAPYIYSFLALGLAYRYNDADRSAFLRITFNRPTYYRIRITENVATVLPFLPFLISQKAFVSALALVPAAVSLIWAGARRKPVRTLPTPFYRRPFEFIVGFRTWLPMLAGAYFLILMGLLYGNFNLGLCALALILMICLTFYAVPEPAYYVWIHRLNTRGFLLQKLKIALRQATVLALPAAAILSVFFPQNIVAVAGILLMGYTYLLTMVLAKYAGYPKALSLPQSILLVLGFTAPPLLLAIIPYFYTQSKRRLGALLT